MNRDEALKTLAVAIDHFMSARVGQQEDRTTLNMLIGYAVFMLNREYPKEKDKGVKWYQKLKKL